MVSPPHSGPEAVRRRQKMFFFSFLGLEMRVLVHSSTDGCLLLHWNTSRYRPPVRPPSLTFQADQGSTKGAGVTAEEGIEYYLIFSIVCACSC